MSLSNNTKEAFIIAMANRPQANEILDLLEFIIDNTINRQTGTNYTVAASDNTVTLDNAAPITVLIEANSVVPIPIGHKIDLIQKGAGKVTFTGGAGVTINSKGGNLSISDQYVAVSIIKEQADSWILIGDLIA